jgi:4-alpha-glucanotransferase
MSSVLAARRAGVLLHPTSLPGEKANGTLGAEAWRFVDWLAASAFSVWQTLPLGPPDAQGSPYTLRSAYAGDPRLLDGAQLAAQRALPRGLDLDAVGGARDAVFASFAAGASRAQWSEFARFARAQRRWLKAYGLFELCAARFDQAPWWEWPEPFRSRQSAPLLEFLAEEHEQFRAILFEQDLFDLQWTALKRYANDRGVYLFGDLPFYVDLNSVEVWWERDVFALDATGNPLAVAGVPPDYFNADGQLWGNPLYDWDAMQRRGFDWWLARFEAQLRRFDLIRIDHFRALESYWAVRAGALTAREGEWRRAPGAELLTALRERFPHIPLVAEDLGMITDDVRALRDRFDLPGMAVLHFAFDGDPKNPHLPANQLENSVVYTGTHDNDTTVGWWSQLDRGQRSTVQRMLELRSEPKMPDALIDAAYDAPARLAVIPLQDLLALPSESRMNSPGTTVGNWRWRFGWDRFDPALPAISRSRAERAARLPPRSGNREQRLHAGFGEVPIGAEYPVEPRPAH